MVPQGVATGDQMPMVVGIDAPHIVFSLGDVRLALQYNLIRVNYKPAEVSSIQKRSPRKVGKPNRTSK